MRIIKIEKQSNGAHAYQTIDRLTRLPEGWAVIPPVRRYIETPDGWKKVEEEMELPNLPYGDITVEKICGVPTVTSWVAGELPEGYGSATEVEPEATADELIDILLGVNADE